MKFPVLVDYEEGIVSSEEPRFENAGIYLLWMRDTYIQDTPFKYEDIREIHNELRDLRPLRYRYQWETLRDVLRLWVIEGLIIPLDPYGRHGGEYTLMWYSYYRKRLLAGKERPSTLAAKLAEVTDTLENLFDSDNEVGYNE